MRSGTSVKINSTKSLRETVNNGYLRSYPNYADKSSIYICKVVDGIEIFIDVFEPA
jgi:hypothetical protein